MRRAIIAALIVRDRGKLRGGLHHRIQRERAARILEKHPLALKGAGVDMGETAADLGEQIHFNHRCLYGIAKLFAAFRRMFLVCKLRHHLDGVFCPEAERVSSGVAV
jgi:hypothetical protein